MSHYRRLAAAALLVATTAACARDRQPEVAQQENPVSSLPIGSCAIAFGEDGPRPGLALHYLQPRQSNHPEGLGGLGMVTSCMLPGNLSPQVIVSLPFLVDKVEVGEYQIIDAENPGDQVQKSWATAHFTVEADADHPAEEFVARSGVVKILEVTGDTIRGAYRVQMAPRGVNDPAEIFSVEGAFITRHTPEKATPDA